MTDSVWGRPATATVDIADADPIEVHLSCGTQEDERFNREIVS